MAKRGLPTGVLLVLGGSVTLIGLLSGLVALTLGFSWLLLGSHASVAALLVDHLEGTLRLYT